MATFPSFPTLPAEMKLHIVRKCLPTAYTRLRRANQKIDAFCEEQRQITGVYLRKQPTIHLTDTLTDLPRNFRDDKWPDDEIDVFCVAVYYGKNAWDTNILLPMTETNVSKVRKAISGFHFERIVVHNNHHLVPDDPNDEYSVELFNEAFANFLKLIRGLMPGAVDVENVSDEQLGELVELFDFPEQFSSSTLSEISEEVDDILYETEVVKFTWYPMNTVEVLPYLLNKRRAEIDFPPGAEKVWEMVEGLLKHLRADELPELEYLKFTFHLDTNFYDVDLETNPGAFRSCNFVFWYKYSYFPTPFGTTAFRADFFLLYIPLFEENAEVPFLIKIKRESFHPHTKVEIYFCLLYDEEGNPREEALRLFLDDITVLNGYPLDLSEVYEEFLEHDPEEMLRSTVEKTFDERVREEGWKYRRGPLNVLHEMVREFWKGPSWILQMRRGESITGRSLVEDYVRVACQEVFCPILQYCTFSPK